MVLPGWARVAAMRDYLQRMGTRGAATVLG